MLGGPAGLPVPTMQALSHADRDPASDPTGEALLDRTHPPFKFWVPEGRALVIGHSQDPEREIRKEAVERDGIPVHRRMGGGGAVLLSPACFCVGLRFAKVKGRSIQDYFAAGSDLIQRTVLSSLGIELIPHGISDLAYSDSLGIRKVAGCSLYMPRDFALYLASVLVAPDYQDLETYLAHPSKEPDYREGRSHREFLVGLAEIVPGSLQPSGLLPSLRTALEAGLKADLDFLSPG